LASYPKQYHPALQLYKSRIEDYQFSAIMIRDVRIDVATEIFTRINVTGKPLSVFEIMVAKTYSPKHNFDLAEKYEELSEELAEVNYSTIPAATVLQATSAILRGECSTKSILGLPKNQFIGIWPEVVDALERSVDYFRSYYRIPVSQLLPYNGLLVPFPYFFFKHKDKPTGFKQKLLQDFFWRVSLGGRYTSGLEGKLAQDLKRFDLILKEKQPKYDWPVDTSPIFIGENGYFSAGRSYLKALLCLLAHHEPKSFIDNSVVTISNDWLKRANSKNYHHFFPKSYLEKTEEYF
jgi:hypothetical protein